MSDVYGKQFKLLASLKNLECWNCTDGQTSANDFEVGETITVLNSHDSSRTVIQCSEENGRDLVNHDGTPYPFKGYRFMVNNIELGKAIGVKMPKQTFDLVGALIDYENGEATEKQTKQLFRHLKRSGIGNKLQGHYSSRM